LNHAEILVDIRTPTKPKHNTRALGLVLSPTSFVVLVFVFRYVLIVCAARNKIQHEVVNTVFEACSFYHCHELGKLSSESTVEQQRSFCELHILCQDSGTLKKQRFYMSGALAHAFGGDDQRSRVMCLFSTYNYTPWMTNTKKTEGIFHFTQLGLLGEAYCCGAQSTRTHTHTHTKRNMEFVFVLVCFFACCFCF